MPFETPLASELPYTPDHTRVLIESYRNEATRCDSLRAAQLLHEVARLYEEILDDPGSALAAVTEALELDPAAPLALRQGLRLLDASGQLQQTADLYRRAIDASDNVGNRVTLLLELATLQELRLGAPDQALVTYQRIRSQDPSNMAATEALLRHHLGRGDWQQVVVLCRELADAESDPESRCTLLLAAGLLSTAEEEKRHLAGQCLATGQNCGASPRSAEGARNRNSDLPLALAVGCLSGQDHVASTVELFQARVETTSAPLQFQISWMLAEPLGRVGEAIPHARTATDIAPDEPMLWEWLAELLRREARWEELVQVLRRMTALMELAGNTEGRVDHHLAAAAIFEGRLRRTELAIEELQAILELEPGHEHAVQWLASLFAREGRWEELAAIHMARAEAPALHADALYDAAVALQLRLGQTEQAIRCLEQALAGEAHGPSTWLLESLYRHTEMWPELVALLSKQVKTASSSSRLGLLVEIAALQEHRLDDQEGAVATYRAIQQLPTSCAASPRSAPQGREERNSAASSWSAPQGREDRNSLRVERALARLYDRLDDAPALVTLLRQMETELESPAERSTLLLHVGQILEHRLADPAAALAQYRRAQELDPSTQGLQQALVQNLINLQRWPELVQQLEARLQTVDDPETRFDLFCRIGWLLEYHLGQRDRAASSYRAALATTGLGLPRDMALRGLLRVLRADDLEHLGQLTPLLEAAPISRLAAASLQRVGLLLGQDPEAPAVLARATQIDPGSNLARFLLLQSQVQRYDWESVIASVPPLYGALVALGGLRQKERALELFREQLTLTPNSLAAARWLELMAASHGRRTLQVEALSSQVHGEHNRTRRITAMHRLAVHAEYGSENTDPAWHYRRILADQPADEQALLALERLARQRNDLPLLLEALRGLCDVVPPESRPAVMTARVSLLLRLQRQDEALELLRLTLEECPSWRPAYDALKILYLERGDSGGLSWTLEQGLDSIADPRTLTADLQRRAQAREERGAVELALADLDRVLEIDPGHAEALDNAVRLLRLRDDLQGLVRRLEQGAQHTTSPRRQATILLALGQLYRDKFAAPARAHEALARAISADPDNVEALLQSAELQQQLEQPTEALALLNRAVLRTRDDDQLIRAQLQIAHICADVLGDPVRARASLEAVLELRPDHREALDLAAQLAERRGETDRLEQLLRRRVELTDDNVQKAELLVQLSGLMRKRLGNCNVEGLRPLEQAVELWPKNPSWLRELVGTYEASGRWSDLDALLEYNLGALEPEEQLPFLLAHGRVLSKQVGRETEARAVLHQVLQGDPENQAAMELLLDQLDGATTRDPKLLEEAIRLHRSLLRRNPLTVVSIRSIHRLCKLIGRIDESFCAGGCLVMLGEATEEERYFHAQLRRRATGRPEGRLTGDEIQSLTLPAGDHPLRQLLLLLHEHLVLLLPPDLGHYGLQSAEETRLPADHPAWDVASVCSGVLKLGHFELLEARGGAPHGVCLPGNPPLLLLPRNVLRLPMPDQLFLFGRLLARVSGGTEVLDPGRSDPVHIRDLDLLVAALLGPAVGNTNSGPAGRTGGANRLPGAMVEDTAQRLARLLSTSDLDDARALATEASTPQNRSAWAAWIHSTEVGACRTGLLCCGGLDCLAQFWTHGDGPISDAVLRELLLFSLDVEFAALRRRLGLQLQE